LYFHSYSVGCQRSGGSDFDYCRCIAACIDPKFDVLGRFVPSESPKKVRRRKKEWVLTDAILERSWEYWVEF
jgi:hypothetical protein